MIHSARRISALAVLGLFASLLGCAANATGGDDDGAPGSTSQSLAGDHYAFGYAWVNPGLPIDSNYAENSGGGAISYSGTAGVYQVRFEELGVSGGSVQVVSYGAAATRCKVSSWSPSGAALLVNVRCHDTSGNAAASPFVVFFNKGHVNAGGRHGHLYFTGTSVPSGYSFNSAGGVNGVTRTSTGRYLASLPGLTFSNAGVHVTAYGADAKHCKIVSWGSAASVSIRCNDNAGNPADSAFVLNVYETTARPFRVGGHAWIDSATTADAAYQQNQHVYSCRTARPVSVTGFQNVTYPDTRPTWSQRTTTMTTAYGDDGSFCKVQYWTTTADGYTVKNICFTPAGAPTTTRFTSSFMGDWAAPC